MLQTLDFIPPVVDDPYLFGRIAAANAMSDIFAMGGIARTALNIAAFPAKKLGIDRMRAILIGAADACAEAGVTVLGGHTVNDLELKFGLAVTGEVSRQNLVTNATARPGDVLVLTKGVGTGILFESFRRETLGAKAADVWSDSMGRLNLVAAEIMVSEGAHAATDVTGFGLLGHAHQLAKASQVTIHIDAQSIPLLPEVVKHAGTLSGGAQRNVEYLDHQLTGGDELTRRILGDPQTSGGLLMAVPESSVPRLMARLQTTGHYAAAMVGRCEAVRATERPGDVHIKGDISANSIG
jgi:selenide,water dikinase